MNYLIARLSRFLNPPVLTRRRIWFAYGVAVATDLLQLLLGPFGWAFVDEVLDVIAMVAISWAIGFHMILLPTFALEFLPLTDMLPTWSGAVAIVVTLRRRREVSAQSASGPVIDV